MEKILGIRPDRTHEDETDAMDRGSLVHGILEKVYTAIAEQSGLYAKHTDDGWKLSQTGEIPLAVFDPDRKSLLSALAHEVADKEFRRAERQPGRHLGHPEIWKNEQKKLLKIVQNVIQTDIDTALEKNRYPALFEMKFDALHDLPIALKRNGERLRFKGKIDRIDLIFDTNNLLKKLLVIDYKGKSRNESLEILSRKIELNLDCQLPLYTFAAQQRFFGDCNSAELNEKTTAVYHLQERRIDKMKNHLRRKQMQMNPQLTKAFSDTLFLNMQNLRSGDLSTEPLIAGFEDYSHICRTTALNEKDMF
jgi:ATP-dependent helicase/DNAse subunit B